MIFLLSQKKHGQQFKTAENGALTGRNKRAVLQQKNIRGESNSFAIQTQDTDAPILNSDELQNIHNFRPDIVDWIVKQTEIEANHRREQETFVSKCIFKERLLGQIFGFLIGLAGVIGGALVTTVSPATGGTIATVAIGTLAVAFLRSGNGNKGK